VFVSELSAQPVSVSKVSAQPVFVSELSAQPVSVSNVSAQPVFVSELSAQPVSVSELSAQPMSSDELLAQSSDLSTQPLSDELMNTHMQVSVPKIVQVYNRYMGGRLIAGLSYWSWSVQNEDKIEEVVLSSTWWISQL